MKAKRRNWQIRAGLIIAMQLLLSFSAFAQKARFEFYTTANGLAGNNTSTVTQDEQGFLWFINGGKIHRYDGRNFLTCLPPLGSPAAREPLLGLASWQDSLLFLWGDHAAFLFNPKTDTWQNVKIKEEHAQNKEMHFWQRSGKDNILIYRIKTGFPEVTVWQFKHNQLAPAPFPKHLPTLNASTSFYWYDIDASGQTYLAYQDTLFQLDQSGNTIAVTPLDDVCTGCHNLYFQFEADGTLVLLANFRFFVLDREKNRFVSHHANRFLQAGRNHLHRFILELPAAVWEAALGGVDLTNFQNLSNLGSYNI